MILLFNVFPELLGSNILHVIHKRRESGHLHCTFLPFPLLFPFPMAIFHPVGQGGTGARAPVPRAKGSAAGNSETETFHL